MNRQPNAELTDSENPEWTEAMFAAARPAAEVLPQLAGRRGRQKAATKVMVTIRLDADVLEYFKAGGEGWQTRLNEALGHYIAEHKGKQAA